MLNRRGYTSILPIFVVHLGFLSWTFSMLHLQFSVNCIDNFEFISHSCHFCELKVRQKYLNKNETILSEIQIMFELNPNYMSRKSFVSELSFSNHIIRNWINGIIYVYSTAINYDSCISCVNMRNLTAQEWYWDDFSRHLLL